MVGKVVKIYADGDLRVEVNGSTWTFNPACVSKTQNDISEVTAPIRQDPTGRFILLMLF